MANLLRRNWRRPGAINTDNWDTPLNQATKWNAEHMFNQHLPQYGPVASTYRNQDENKSVLVFWIADGGKVEMMKDGDVALRVWREGDTVHAEAKTSKATHHFQVESNPQNQQNGWCFVSFSRWYSGSIRKTICMKLDLGNGRQQSLADPSSGGSWNPNGYFIILYKHTGYLSWMDFPSSSWANWFVGIMFGWMLVWFDGVFKWDYSVDLTPILEARDRNAVWYQITTHSPEVVANRSDYPYHFDVPDGVRMARAWIVGGGQGGQGGSSFSGSSGQSGLVFGPIRVSRQSYDGVIGVGGAGGAGVAEGSGRGAYGKYGTATTFAGFSSDSGLRWVEVFTMGKWHLKNTYGMGGSGGRSASSSSTNKSGDSGGAGAVVFYLQF